MVQKSLVLILIAFIFSGCAVKPEIITVTERVEIPIIRYKSPDVPKHFSEKFVSSDIKFYSNKDFGVCLSDADSKKLRYDIERASGRINAQIEWIKSLENSEISE